MRPICERAAVSGCLAVFLLWGISAGMADEDAATAPGATPTTIPAGRSAALEEVIVTARRREESLQDTPVAVTALSGDELREAGILNARDLANLVPSLQINQGVSNQIYIRGIGERTGFARIDPAVGVYLDDLFLPRADDQLLDTVDIRSVQVLRGPQGTLFGKNNTGGAVVFTLEKPHEAFEAYVEAGIGNFNSHRARVGVNLPINERFFTRLALNNVSRDGYIKDLSGSRFQSDGRISALLQTRWLATRDVTVDSLLFYGRTREKLAPVNCEITNPDAILNQGFGFLWPGDTDPANPRAYSDNCRANSRDELGDLTSNMGPGANMDKELDILMLGTTLSWDIDDDHTIKAIAGLRSGVKKPGLQSNVDGGPQRFIERFNIEDGDRFSASLELQWHGSTVNQRLQFTGGLFGMLETNTEETLSFSPIVGIDSSSLAALAAGEKPGTPPPGGTNPPLVGGLLGLPRSNEFDLESRTLAAFFQGTFQLRENLELTAGGRYTQEQRISRYRLTMTDMDAFSARLGGDPRFVTVSASNGLHAFLGSWLEDPISIANSLFTDDTGDGYMNTPQVRGEREQAKATFGEFTPMVSLSWFVPDNWLASSRVDSTMVYATWSRGFKAGLFEPAGVDGLQEVKPETVENRELGIKIDAFERRVRFNLAAYSMVYDDMQLIQVGLDSQNSTTSVFENAAEARIDGVEAELRWLPLADLLLTASFSHNRYRFVEWIEPDLVALALRGDFIPVDRSDETFPASPERTAALGIQYHWTTGIGTFVPRVDVSYKSDVYLGFDRSSWLLHKRDPSKTSAEAYALVDARLSWHRLDERLSVTAFAKNVFDERYLIGAVSIADSVGTFTQVDGAPRTYGLEVRLTF